MGDATTSLETADESVDISMTKTSHSQRKIKRDLGQDEVIIKAFTDLKESDGTIDPVRLDGMVKDLVDQINLGTYGKRSASPAPSG